MSAKARTEARVDAYLGKAAPFAQPILAHLRQLVGQEAPGATETIKWGMPHFVYGGSILCGIAAFKAHCAFWFWHQGMKQVIGSTEADDAEGMGHFGRITKRADLPSDRVLRQYVRAAVKLIDAGVPARSAQRKRRPDPKVPADLAAALKKHAKAAQVFRDFSPSHRRDYIEWVEEAKRPETRRRRLETTVKWLTAGRARNWKYERC